MPAYGSTELQGSPHHRDDTRVHRWWEQSPGLNNLSELRVQKAPLRPPMPTGAVQFDMLGHPRVEFRCNSIVLSVLRG